MNCRDPRKTDPVMKAIVATPVPRDAPLKIRAAYYAVKFLSFHNRLDGIMCFVAVWWATWTMIDYPNWGPIEAALQTMTGGLPQIVSWTLLLSGALGYWSIVYKHDWVRTFCSLLGFSMWMILFIAHAMAEPMYSPAVACYSVFAIAKLIAYVGHQIGVDVERQAETENVQ